MKCIICGGGTRAAAVCWKCKRKNDGDWVFEDIKKEKGPLSERIRVCRRCFKKFVPRAPLQSMCRECTEIVSRTPFLEKWKERYLQEKSKRMKNRRYVCCGCGKEFSPQHPGQKRCYMCISPKPRNVSRRAIKTKSQDNKMGDTIFRGRAYSLTNYKKALMVAATEEHDSEAIDTLSTKFHLTIWQKGQNGKMEKL